MSENKIENQVFTYPLIFRLIFRYGNIIITAVLIIYSLLLFAFLSEKINLAFPLVVNLLIIYFLNRHYFNLYKILPYTIKADDDKINCLNYLFSKREIVIYYKDITSLSGGIFENKLSGIMKVCDDKNNVVIGFYQKLNNSGKLATILLSKVNHDVYDSVLTKIMSAKKKDKK